jgi:hypothetical protein
MKNQHSRSRMASHFLSGALRTIPLALSPLINTSMMLGLKLQLLFKTEELQIPSNALNLEVHRSQWHVMNEGSIQYTEAGN